MSTEEIARLRHLDASGGRPDYPRAATDFFAIGAPDFAIICWLAANRPTIAERIYEHSSFYLVDNQLGPRIPVWRMIVGVKTGDAKIVDEGRADYMRAMEGAVPRWLERTLARL